MLCRRALSSKISSPTTTRVLLAFVTAGLALHLDACAEGTTEAPGAHGDSGGTAGKGAMGGFAGNGLTLGLQATNADGQYIDRLHLKPSSVSNIVVTTTPPGVHTLRFGLLGAPLDAVLGATLVDTDADYGMARVTLVAPSTPTTFSVRASTTGAPSVTLDLAVPKTSMATIWVNPSYPGERIVKGVVASAWQDTTCADLQGSPPDDNPALTASNDRFPVELLVPADTRLAVTMRAARFAWGCTTINAAVEGVQNDVEVVMTNVPMKLDTSNVDFTLELHRDDQVPPDPLLTFQSALVEPEQAFLTALLGTADDDVDALLGAMTANAPSTDAFRTARRDLGWDARLRSALGATAADALRAPVARWMQAGIAASGGALEGSLRGVAGEPPVVTLSSVFGVPPNRAGFAPNGTPTWEAGADDGILIGMSMSVLPAQFLLGAAHDPAVHEATSATTVSGALAEVLSCATVAGALVAHGRASGESTKGCDESCTESLCESALHWLLATALAAGEPSTLAIALTASASVGDDAELDKFNGNWLGHWSLPAGTTSLNGAALGAASK